MSNPFQREMNSGCQKSTPLVGRLFAATNYADILIIGTL
jgi:hypothetical protein